MLEPFLENKLSKLNLSHNAFGPIGIPGFDFLLEKQSTLKELYLINDGLGPKGGEMVAEALLKSSNKLEVISVPRNRLENDGFIAFAKVFNQMKSFKVIEMYQNFCKKEGMAAVIQSLSSNENLHTVHIHDNWLTDQETIDILCDYLMNAKSLISLNLSDCKIKGINVFQII